MFKYSRFAACSSSCSLLLPVPLLLVCRSKLHVRTRRFGFVPRRGPTPSRVRRGTTLPPVLALRADMYPLARLSSYQHNRHTHAGRSSFGRVRVVCVCARILYIDNPLFRCGFCSLFAPILILSLLRHFRPKGLSSLPLLYMTHFAPLCACCFCLSRVVLHTTTTHARTHTFGLSLIFFYCFAAAAAAAIVPCFVFIPLACTSFVYWLASTSLFLCSLLNHT